MDQWQQLVQLHGSAVEVLFEALEAVVLVAVVSTLGSAVVGCADVADRFAWLAVEDGDVEFMAQ